ncbi:putative pectinesterasepectinesterase inhibitor 51 [Nicotiana attenuata]|uniref:Pectinesterasepectinesterase inhibitor 51 n=1 Tax=Nicotiana attenuata TaxID=49451 RepID=A0A1J6KEA2_NICAT|nr:putative pectinesterasepectinesterase inhibitor 51 [Nicotiana attenuata]
MASHFSLPFLSFFLFVSLVSSSISQSPSPSPNIPIEIQGACKASRDPPTCEASILTDPSNLTPVQIILSALAVSSQNLTNAQLMVKNLLDTSAGNVNLTVAAKNCLLGFNYSAYRYNLTAAAFPRGEIKDARAWMSAALGYQIGCSSNLLKVNETIQVAKTLEVMNTSINFTTNALWMTVSYDIHGNDTGLWGPPKTERDGFWEPGSGSGFGFKGGVPSGLNPNVTVCKEGGCDYKMVQEAVNATPDNLGPGKFVIWIKAGLYDEIVRVPLGKRNVVFLGDGMGKTVITGSLSVGLMPGMTTYESATVGKSITVNSIAFYLILFPCLK